MPSASLHALLEPARDCGDLLTRVQNDAIAKLKMQVELYKKQPPQAIGTRPGGPVRAGSASAPGSAPPSLPQPSAPVPESAVDEAGDADTSGGSGKNTASVPTGASDTNRQVADVDEADFVKVVQRGKQIFLLHGNTLRKLKSWPPTDTALVGEPLVLEGSASEMFVSEGGKAVVFSTVYGAVAVDAKPPVGASSAAAPCRGRACGGGQLKITVADLSGAAPKVERELYYEGSYLSSRRYASAGSDVVRAIVQAPSRYSGLFAPDIEWVDAWGRPYAKEELAAQLDAWEARTSAAIRKTALSDWLPRAHEKKGGVLTEIAPDCDAYYVPSAGVADYGLTHVLSLDVASPAAPVGGVTIVGASSTVYSSAARLVLAQPDYRWNAAVDFGIASSQQTALHVFDLEGASTRYVASGSVFGNLPARNPQFGIDVASDGTLRLATTGAVRDEPTAEPDDPAFFRQHVENYVITARVRGDQVEVIGKSPKLGHEGESVQSARFVKERAYVVTFRQTDPLIVLDVADASAPKVLGEIEIPGFSEYVHPLDATHLVTVGQSAQRGIQLQLFDVSNPARIPAPQTLDFGSGSASEVSYNHKAFTAYEGMLAIPVSGRGVPPRFSYSAALELVKVDIDKGFQWLGRIDHAPLYADNGAGVRCGRCDAGGCYEYVCGYSPDVRRGHFIAGEGKTYVYSFSYAGVLVHDLGALKAPLAKVGLPAPVLDGGPYPVPPPDLPTSSPGSAPRPATTRADSQP